MPTRKIRITGPESAGKTTLTQALARHFACPWVPEYARTYLTALDRPYVQKDLDEIWLGQRQAEQELSVQYPDAPYLFCDTGPEVLYIWSKVKYGEVSPLLTNAQRHPYDFTLLCAPDLPWEADPLREAPAASTRWALFAQYQGLLDEQNVAYQIIRGERETRFLLALSNINLKAKSLMKK
ncbi:MAG: ATP-binding protein [Bacteroidota bacterium]